MCPALTGIQFGTIQGWVIVFKFPFSSDTALFCLMSYPFQEKNNIFNDNSWKRRKKVKLARDFCEECKKRFLKKAHLFCWELCWLWTGQIYLKLSLAVGNIDELLCHWSVGGIEVFFLRGEDRKVRRIRKVQEADIKLSCFLLLWYKHSFTLLPLARSSLHIRICLCGCFNGH